MNNYMDNFRFNCEPKAHESHSLSFDDVRLQVLTPCLLRVEISPDKEFCSLATQSVWFRSFCRPSFTYTKADGIVTITTCKCCFTYSLLQHRLLSVKLNDGRLVTEFKKGNLKGTRRTLDGTAGRAALQDGVISRNGVAVLSDGNSLIFSQDGRLMPKTKKRIDDYYFAYGMDYITAVQDFFKLTGMPPLIPRFALGNWWSRYRAYTQDEYEELIDKFHKEKIPLSVATVDMDWHWVDVVSKFGKEAKPRGKRDSFLQLFYDTMSPGWTGYSWNTELFPDYKAFLQKLHDKGLKVTLNIHPGTGVRFFEDSYKDVCEHLGINANDRRRIAFDITDDRFLEAYFKYLHHPHEEDGVDFWWIDWQQGKNTSIKGLDPLWALNHYHYLDSKRNGKRPLILSRFAGVGSHRYPLGFSGDTAQRDSTLDFQPYFTSTATNIGYTWWSHDIGGHHLGSRSDERYLRWLQFGVFSPIMRLHSTSDEFMGKEPWKFRSSTAAIAAKALRFRHRLLPYLYTMNYRSATEGRGLIEPMYYENPGIEAAYNVPNEYCFGSELIVCTITEMLDKRTFLASTKTWLPVGRYTDIFNGRVYQGGKTIYMHRDEASIPVLAREGAIIPLQTNCTENGTQNPDELELLIYRGNGSFSMYEDDGLTESYKNGAYCFTDFAVSENEASVVFTIDKIRGDSSVTCSKKSYYLSFRDISDAKGIDVRRNGRLCKYELSKAKGFISIHIDFVKPDEKIRVSLDNITARTSGKKQELMVELFSRIEGNNMLKQRLYTSFVLNDSPAYIPKYLKPAVDELKSLIY